MDTEVKMMFGLYNDGGNCWARGSSRPQWYWARSWNEENETRSEFRKRLVRMGRGKAQKNYYDYVDAGTYGAKVFTDWNTFYKAARKVGLNPECPAGLA